MFNSDNPAVQGDYYRKSGQFRNRVSPKGKQIEPKLSHSPGHWKKYIPQGHLKSPQRRDSYQDLNYQKGDSGITYVERDRFITTNGAQQIQFNKFEQQKRRKQEMMKRVEEIQKKVYPILNSQKYHEESSQNFGWYNRMEQRILKLQTSIDLIQKQMEIKIEKRLMQVEREWNLKLQSIAQTPKQRKMEKVSSINRINRSPKGEKEEQEYFSHQKYASYNIKNQYQKNEEYGQGEEINYEGYFTKRENELKERSQKSQNGRKMK